MEPADHGSRWRLGPVGLALLTGRHGWIGFDLLRRIGMTIQAQAKPIDAGMIPFPAQFLSVNACEGLALKSLLPATFPPILVAQGGWSLDKQDYAPDLKHRFWCIK